MPGRRKLVTKFGRNRRCCPKTCPHLKTDSLNKIRLRCGYSGEFPGYVESIYKVLANQEPCSIQLWKVAILAKMGPFGRVSWRAACATLLLGFKGRCWSKTCVCHISLSIQQILIKFTAFVYCMKILQIVKFDLICIMVAMVTDRS